MKKNTMMRIASVLMVAVLLSTCAISSTFAKYVSSESAGDTARIAKWGVTVSANGDNAFATKYDNKASDSGTKVVSATTVTETDNGKVIAPGTNGKLGGVSFAGSPEVAVSISVTASLELENWIDAYCPLVFKFSDNTIIKMGDTIDTIDELEAAVAKKFTDLSTTEAANDPFNNGISCEWSWPYTTNSENDKKDTALGDKIADATELNPTIEFSCSVTVTQVD